MWVGGCNNGEKRAYVIKVWPLSEEQKETTELKKYLVGPTAWIPENLSIFEQWVPEPILEIYLLFRGMRIYIFYDF